MIGAWCRATGWLIAVGDTPEELADKTGFEAGTIRQKLKGGPPHIPGKYSIIIKRIAK